MSENNYFVPDATFGGRRDTAIALTGAADEFGISQRAVKATAGGFRITDELANLVFEDVDGGDEGDETDEQKAAREAAEAEAAEAEAERLAAEQAEAERLAAEQAEAEAKAPKDSETKDAKSKGSKQTSGNRAAKTTGTNKE